MINKLKPLLSNFRKQRELWLLCIPILVWVGVFAYYPMYGLIIAFFNYTPGREIFDSTFVGLKNFTTFLQNPIIWTLLRNTLAMSLLGITVGFSAPIIFALLINEIHHTGAKKFIQTASYLPHFISWVVAGSIIYMMLSSEGVINDILMRLGIIKQAVPFLATGKYYWTIFTLANIWKGIGWSSIIYLSAIAGVDAELYEAAATDGLGRLGMAWHITLPSILPTIAVLWILGIGSILNAGFDQHLILGNPLTQQYWDVIDTYAYRFGVQQGQYSVGTAVSMMKSIIGFGLVFIANKVCKKIFELSIF